MQCGRLMIKLQNNLLFLMFNYLKRTKEFYGKKKLRLFIRNTSGIEIDFQEVETESEREITYRL